MPRSKKADNGRVDTNQEDANAQAGRAPVPFTVNLQYIKDLSFEVPHGHVIFTRLQAPPQVSIDIDVQGSRIEQDKPLFEVVLSIKAKAVESGLPEGQKPRPVFIAELKYGAVVTLENIPAELIEPMLLVETPRLLFPFARAIICDVTREGGFPPIILQPIDFVALWQNRRAARTPAPNAPVAEA